MVIKKVNSDWASEIVRRRDSETVRQWDSETVRRWEGETVRWWDGETVRRWDGETVRQWDSETVRQGTRARQERQGRAICIQYNTRGIVRQWDSILDTRWLYKKYTVIEPVRQWDGETVRQWDRGQGWDRRDRGMRRWDIETVRLGTRVRQVRQWDRRGLYAFNIVLYGYKEVVIEPVRQWDRGRPYVQYRWSAWDHCLYRME